MQRRYFLAGTLTGLTAGVALEKLADYHAPEPVAAVTEAAPLPWYWQFASPSFAQQAEDLIIQSIFQNHLMIERPTFIDIGAYHPVYSNNTFLLYLDGSRGVLVEPNPAYTELLRQGRPEDTVLNIGIGVTDETAADFYVFDQFSQLNTFSKTRADEYIAEHGPGILKEVVKMPLININTVLGEHFEGGPDLFSIDVEGMDLAILETLDFERFRPRVFCIETGVFGGFDVNDGIHGLMRQQGYVLRANTFTNSIFIDSDLLADTTSSPSEGPTQG